MSLYCTSTQYTIHIQLCSVDQSQEPVSEPYQKGLQPIVVMNKVDRDGVTPEGCSEVESKLFDLFAALGANDDQLDFPVLYASAREVGRCRPAPGLKAPGFKLSP